MEHHEWAWKPDRLVMVMLGMSAMWYAAGAWQLHRSRALRGWEVASWAVGWLTLALALLSPLATASEWLFSVHMTQHEVLMLVTAPLLALGRPIVPMLHACPARWRRAGVAMGRTSIALRVLTAPLSVFLMHAVALWLWHLPWLYEAAVVDDRVHLLQHLSFVGTAVLFWWSLLCGRYGRLGYGVALVYVFATAVHTGGLGALLAGSARPWYPLYAARAAGLADPVADQALAGVIMWVPAGVVFLVVGLALFAAWLGEAERRRAKGWWSEPGAPVR